MCFQTRKPCEYWSVCVGHSKMWNEKEHTGTRMCHSRGDPVPTDTHCHCRQTELRGAVCPFSFPTSECKATNLMRRWAHVPTSYELQVSTGIGIRWPESNWLKSYLGKWLPWPQFPQVWNRKYLLCLLHRVIVNIWTHWHNTYKGTLQAVNVTSITLYVIYPISIYSYLLTKQCYYYITPPSAAWQWFTCPHFNRAQISSNNVIKLISDCVCTVPKLLIHKWNCSRPTRSFFLRMPNCHFNWLLSEKLTMCVRIV